jgi:hypothetical protein
VAIAALVAVAGAAAIGCALGVGVESETDQSGDADAKEAGAADGGGDQADGAADGRVIGVDAPSADTGRAENDAWVENDSRVDTAADGGSADASGHVDGEAGPDAALEAGEDAGLDTGPELDTGPVEDAGADGGADAGLDAEADAGFDADAGYDTDAGLDAGPEAGVDAGVDTGCNIPPQVTFVTPTSGATIHVHTRDSSTFVSAFSVHVDFPCAPMQTVQFDYVGPAGSVAAQEAVFASYTDPFAEQTQVGGATSSLAAFDGGQSTSSWLFSVTAVDANNQATAVSQPFTLVVTNH